MTPRTKWRRLEIVVFAAFIGSVVSALPLRLLANTVSVPTFVVWVSAWALGKFASDACDAIPALTQSLHDPDEAVRQEAADAIKQIDGDEGT